MFIIYMNDIYKVSDKFHSILYADDTTLESPLCTFDTSGVNNKYRLDTLSKNINEELHFVYEWLCLNKLSLNIKKTKFMIFHHRQRNIESIIPNLSTKWTCNWTGSRLQFSRPNFWWAHDMGFSYKQSFSENNKNTWDNVTPQELPTTRYSTHNL